MENCACLETFLKTEIGVLKIQCCQKGVHSINILSHNTSSIDKENSDTVLATSNDEKVESTLKSVMSWLNLYFASSIKDTTHLPPVCMTVFSNKGDFTVKVWKTLMSEVGFGKTVSYSELAALSGNKAASRAVGSAMKNNSIPLIIPCHRVIKSDGKVGHFSGGQNIKKWLLEHEKASSEYLDT